MIRGRQTTWNLVIHSRHLQPLTEAVMLRAAIARYKYSVQFKNKVLGQTFYIRARPRYARLRVPLSLAWLIKDNALITCPNVLDTPPH